MQKEKRRRLLVSILSGLLAIVMVILFLATGAKVVNDGVVICSTSLISALTTYNSLIYVNNIVGISIELGLIGVGLVFTIARMIKPKYGRIISIFSFIFYIAAFFVTIMYKDTFKLTFTLILASVIEIATFIYCLVFSMKYTETEEKVSDDESENKLAPAVANIVISILSLVVLAICFVIPPFNHNGINAQSLLNSMINSANIAGVLAFIVCFVLIMLCVISSSNSLLYIKSNRQMFYKKSRRNLYLNFALSILFYVYCIVMLFTNAGVSVSGSTEGQYTLGFIPFVLNGILIVLQSIFTAKYMKTSDEDKTDYNVINRTIIFLFTILFVVISVGALLTNIMTVTYTASGLSQVITVNGTDVLKNYSQMNAGYQAMAFLIYAMLIILGVLVIVTFALFFNRSRFYYKSAILTIGTSYLLTFALALFGKYYEIAQKINEDSINTILSSSGLSITVDYTYVVKSNTLYFFFGSTILLLILAIIRPFSKHYKDEAIDVNVKSDVPFKRAPQGPIDNPSKFKEATKQEAAPEDFDACPAFSEIDEKENEFNIDYQNKVLSKYDSPNLPELCSFVVDYARNSRLHLSYSVPDIAQFVAGLGATKLSILQGMSGTGKTSLPKIFTEAIMGNVDIIEVESSWKDKNELIGYYNEFSQKFTPKKFTQALYKAKFYPDVITLIVLDEMNLSRIEYYFSDFLSLMENEEDKRQIQLLNVKLSNTVDGKEIEYKKLNDGHTLMIPKNVWFIGTANRDESTFEISDKVYDRANTINFNKRAPKVSEYVAPMSPRFLSYEDFVGMLQVAKQTFNFNSEENETIKAVEKILEPYNISFGNRIEKQIDEFVSVYCSCFVDAKEHVADAVERILLSKVVAKLEFKSVENKEKLADQFDSINLHDCAKFVRKLNEGI